MERAEQLRPADARVGGGLLIALSLACCGLYLAMGAGFVLDDWYFVRNARLDGAVHTAGDVGGDRPAGALVWVLLFGGFGPHPAPILITMAVANGTSALLFERLLRRVLPTRLAFLAAALWVLLPLRTSLEAWMATSVAVAAQLAGLASLVLLLPADPKRSAVAASATLVAIGTLCYESLPVVTVPAAIALRWAVTRRFDARTVLPVVLAATVATGWALLHLDPGRTGVGWHSLLPVLGANFGWGVAPGATLSAIALAAALLGSALVVRRSAPGRPRADAEATAIVTGLAVVVLGALPYVRYIYEPFGAGDRHNYLSSFGGALVWAGLVSAAWQLRRALGVASLAALLLCALPTRVARTGTWTTAGRDGWRVAHAIAAGHPSPTAPILVGPAPILVDNIAAFADPSNVRGAVQFAYGRRVRADLSGSHAEWSRASELDYVKVDQRPLSRLDDRKGRS